MANTQITYTFENLLSTTAQKHMPKIEDNFYKSTAFLARLLRGDMIQELTGERIIQPIYKAGNTTVKSYSPFGSMDVSRQQILNVAQFTWRHIAGTLSISDIHVAMNAGDGRAAPLVKGLINGLKLSFREELSRQLLQAYSAGNGGDDLDPINLMVTVDPTLATTYGGIDPSAETYWRNQYRDSDGTNYATNKQNLFRSQDDASKGGGGYPDFGMWDYNTQEMFKASIASLQRYEDAETAANFGHRSLRVQGIDYFADEFIQNVKAQTNTTSGTDNGTVYTFNSKFLHVAVLRNRAMQLGPFIEARDADGKTAKLTWSGAVYTSARRKQAVLFGIDNTVTA